MTGSCSGVLRNRVLDALCSHNTSSASASSSSGCRRLNCLGMASLRSSRLRDDNVRAIGWLGRGRVSPDRFFSLRRFGQIFPGLGRDEGLEVGEAAAVHGRLRNLEYTLMRKSKLWS